MYYNIFYSKATVLFSKKKEKKKKEKSFHMTIYLLVYYKIKIFDF